MPQHSLKVAELELSCHVRGEGETVVLIHGFPFDHTMWQEQINALSSTHRVVAPDLRGYGHSQQDASDALNGVEMHVYAQDILAMLDALQIEEPVVFCGFSMGGYILWQIALQAPQRVRGMILCDTRAVADTEAARTGRLEMADNVATSGVEPVVTAMLPKLLAQATLDQNQDLVDRVANLIRQASPAAIAASQRGMAVRPDVSTRLHTLTQPALVVVGAEDAISPSSEMQEIADALPQAKFVEIPGAGHMAPWENPEKVNSVFAEFLAKLR